MANPTAARNKQLCTTEKQPKISHLPSAIELLNKHTSFVELVNHPRKIIHARRIRTYMRKLK